MIEEMKVVYKNPGPYTEVRVNGRRLEVRLDTGADITMLPVSYLDMTLPLRTIRIQMADGGKSVLRTYRAIVEIEGKEFDIDALPTLDNIRGLLGMDVLKDCYLYMAGGVWELGV
jgi:predicted aspartyl protease